MSEPFKVVSFYTKDTAYVEHAERLKASLKRFSIPYEIDGVESATNWEWNCAKIASFVRTKWLSARCPVVWLDADATVEQYPALFRDAREFDFGVHKWNDNHFGGGTLYFARTPSATALIEEWCIRCDQDPTTWVQKHLETAWELLSQRIALRTLWLPRSYLQIFDQPTLGQKPVIMHWQASRVEKKSGRALAPHVVGER